MVIYCHTEFFRPLSSNAQSLISKTLAELCEYFNADRYEIVISKFGLIVLVISPSWIDDCTGYPLDIHPFYSVD